MDEVKKYQQMLNANRKHSWTHRQMDGWMDKCLVRTTHSLHVCVLCPVCVLTAGIYTIKCQHGAKRLENSQKRVHTNWETETGGTLPFLILSCLCVNQEVRDTEKRLENTTKCHQLHDEMM